MLTTSMNTGNTLYLLSMIVLFLTKYCDNIVIKQRDIVLFDYYINIVVNKLRFCNFFKCGLIECVVFRHVILPADLARNVPKSHLMTETEWRNVGVQQSPDWVHYMMHSPEPHVLLFRRPRTDIPHTATTNGHGDSISL